MKHKVKINENERSNLTTDYKILIKKYKNKEIKIKRKEKEKERKRNEKKNQVKSFQASQNEGIKERIIKTFFFIYVKSFCFQWCFLFTN